MIKRILCLLLCLAPLTASGCATFGRSYIEFSQMDLVQALGLDLADDGSNEIIVTAISRVSGEAGDGNGSGAQKARVSIGRGSTLMEALSSMSSYTDKELFLGHTSHIIVGERLARHGLGQIIDFFIRNYRIRMDLSVTIARESTACDFIRASVPTSQFLTDRLDRLYQANTQVSTIIPMRCVDIFASLLEPTSTQQIPYVRYLSGEMTGLAEENPILLSGYGVCSQGRLLGYLDDSAAVGYNWLAGDIHSHTYVVRDLEHNLVTLAISYSKSQVSVEILDDAPYVTCHIDVTAVLTESNAAYSLYTPEDLDAMAAQLTQQIESQLLEVIEISRQWGVDILGIGARIAASQPRLWESLSSHWSQVYPQSVFALDVETLVQNAYQNNRIPTEDTP